MRTVAKTEEHPALVNGRNHGWDWDEFRGNDHDGYLAVRQQALTDQCYECAYCGLWIGEGTSQKVHLDHFRKKGIYGELALVYDNLFAAVKDMPYGSDYKDKMIHGPKENADAQYLTFWSPLVPDLDSMFWYRQDGQMEPKDSLSAEDKVMAKNTIDMYNLNHPYLKQRRSELMHIIDGLKDCDDDTIRMCLGASGFSFLVDFELNQIRNNNL